MFRPEAPTPIERFYQCLLRLDRHTRDVSTLDEALQLLVEITGVQIAYIEVLCDGDLSALSRSYDVERRPHDAITAMVAHEIVAQAIAERRTITLDRRVSEITTGTTLCIPISTEAVTGVLWLHGKTNAFSMPERDRAQRFAERVSDLRLGGAPKRTLKEEVRALYERRVREVLLSCHGNVSEAARELGVSRSFIHAVLKRRNRRTRYSS